MTTPSVDYSIIAGYYDEVRAASPEYLKYWSSKVARLGALNREAKVLDIGCGTGRYTIPIASITGAHVFGIEPSEEMLDAAVKKNTHRDICWGRGVGESLAFRGESFDCVLMTFVLHHIEDKKKAISEMFRVLRPGGRCIIITTSHGHIRRSPLYLFPKLAAIDLVRFPSLPWLKSMLEEGGFKNVHYHLDMYGKRRIGIKDLLDRVKRKYISTLDILENEDFVKGYEIFEKQLRNRFEDHVELKHGVYMVSGEKIL
jgi:ubiquinone/menaquinone biosynthesis C-methylase UbiE